MAQLDNIVKEAVGMSTMHYRDLADVLTVKEVAEFLQTKASTVYTLIKRNQLPAIRVGNGFRIPKKGMAQYLKINGVAPDDSDGFQVLLRNEKNRLFILVRQGEKESRFPTGYSLGAGNVLVKDDDQTV